MLHCRYSYAARCLGQLRKKKKKLGDWSPACPSSLKTLPLALSRASYGSCSLLRYAPSSRDVVMELENARVPTQRVQGEDWSAFENTEVLRRRCRCTKGSP